MSAHGPTRTQGCVSSWWRSWRGLAAVLHLQLGRRDRWPSGLWARGREGQAWVVGCVCPARPHAPAWKGEGAVHTCVACPSSFCHTLTLLQSEATADPPPLPRLDVQACSFLAQGPTPPSSWTFGFFCLECHPPQHAHTHANTAICPHVCIQSHVYPYTPHVHTCLRAHMQPTDEHIHVCSHQLG